MYGFRVSLIENFFFGQCRQRMGHGLSNAIKTSASERVSIREMRNLRPVQTIWMAHVFECVAHAIEAR